MIILCVSLSWWWRWLMTTVIWVILVGPVFGGRCGAEALGLGLGLSPGPAYRFALPPGLAAKTTRCLVFDQGRHTSHLHCRDRCIFDLFRFWHLFDKFLFFKLCYSNYSSGEKNIPQWWNYWVIGVSFWRTERIDDIEFLYARMPLVTQLNFAPLCEST